MKIKSCDSSWVYSYWDYIIAELQVKVLEKLWRALNPGAFLVLGSTEAVAAPMRDYFEVADISGRIYRRK